MGIFFQSLLHESKLQKSQTLCIYALILVLPVFHRSSMKPTSKLVLMRCEFILKIPFLNHIKSEHSTNSHFRISEPDFIIESAAGMHYCDLLSPYRALEWIYIRGVQHGEHY